MADDEITTSLLNEYSIAEVVPDNAGNEVHIGEIHRESLRDAFSRYAKVIFHDIADSYPTDADVQCFFSLTLDMKYKEGDVVGLFRLGWRSPSEMITSQIVPIPVHESQRDFQVQFLAADLPKDEGEIYQLCYISDNEVWGASVPFEFRRATAEELLVVDSGDIVIVRSQSAVAEDLKCQLATLRKELVAAEASNVEGGKKLTEMQKENELLKGRLKDLEKVEQVLERLRADNQALDMARNDSEDDLRKAQLRIVTLDSVISSLQVDVDKLQVQVTTQSEEITKQQAIAQCATSQRGCSLDLIEALREGKELAVREMRTALAENEKMQRDLIDAADERDALRAEIDDFTKKYQDVLQTLEESETAHKKRIEDLLVQLTQLTSDSQLRVNEANMENQVLQKQVLTLENEIKNKGKISASLTSSEGPISPQLQVASPKKPQDSEESVKLKVLQKRLEDVQTRYSEVSNEIAGLRDEMNILQETEALLLASHSRLTNRMNCLHSIVAEAEGSGNTMEASLHQRELVVSRAKLEEKTVCLESVRQRRDELEKQLKELEQESSVLIQQEADTTAACETFVCSITEAASTSEANQVEPDEAQFRESFHCAPEALNGQVEVEVADLRERLRQAAEAYKALYREKRQTEKELSRLQNIDKHREDDAHL